MNTAKKERDFRKRVTRRLKRSDPVRWEGLSEEERLSAVEVYADLVDPKNLDPLSLINETWNRADAVDNLMMGVLLGLFGTAAGNVIENYLAPAGIVYEFFAVTFFLGIFFIFNWIPGEILNRSYKEGRLLEKLLREKKS